MFCANVDGPKQGFEEQGSILATNLRRVGARAYERDAEASSLELHFLVHIPKLVVSTTLCNSVGNPRELVVNLLLKVNDAVVRRLRGALGGRIGD